MLETGPIPLVAPAVLGGVFGLDRVATLPVRTSPLPPAVSFCFVYLSARIGDVTPFGIVSSYRYSPLSLHNSLLFSPVLSSRVSVCLCLCLFICLSVVWFPRAGAVAPASASVGRLAVRDLYRRSDISFRRLDSLIFAVSGARLDALLLWVSAPAPRLRAPPPPLAQIVSSGILCHLRAARRPYCESIRRARAMPRRDFVPVPRATPLPRERRSLPAGYAQAQY